MAVSRSGCPSAGQTSGLKLMNDVHSQMHMSSRWRYGFPLSACYLTPEHKQKQKQKKDMHKAAESRSRLLGRSAPAQRKCSECPPPTMHGDTLRFIWVPSHVTIEGNEQADKLAENGRLIRIQNDSQQAKRRRMAEGRDLWCSLGLAEMLSEAEVQQTDLNSDLTSDLETFRSGTPIMSSNENVRLNTKKKSSSQNVMHADDVYAEEDSMRGSTVSFNRSSRCSSVSRLSFSDDPTDKSLHMTEESDSSQNSQPSTFLQQMVSEGSCMQSSGLDSETFISFLSPSTDVSDRNAHRRRKSSKLEGMRAGRRSSC